MRNCAPDMEKPDDPRPRRSRTPWLLGAAALLFVLLVGSTFLFPSPISAPPPVAVAPSLRRPAATRGGDAWEAANASGSPGGARRRKRPGRPDRAGNASAHRLSSAPAARSAGASPRCVRRSGQVRVSPEPDRCGRATRDGGDWTAARLDVPVDERIVVVAGTLKDNLFESMDRLGKGLNWSSTSPRSSLGLRLCRRLPAGDRFRMLVEKVFTQERFVKYGRILAAEYESEGRVHSGVYFKDKNGGGYYTRPANRCGGRS